MLQSLKKSNLDEKQLRQVDVAISSADSLLVLINDILDFSKIEAGKLNVEAIEFNLGDQINSIIDTISHTLPQDSDIALKTELEGIDDQVVIGDHTRLRQVIANLMTNAIKFTAKGEITLKAALESRSDNFYCFRCSVIDTGIGIEEEKLDELFQEFTQADSSTTRKYGGTGLGLSICKRLCELMGGSIGVRSEIGKGSCFSFDVELGRAVKESESSEKNGNDLLVDNGSVSSDLRFSKEKILLVEDNEINQFVVEDMILDFGLEIDICSNGVEALNALKKDAYALVLMDCQMPEMDGYEATQRIRNGEAGEGCEKIPIIAMTANALQGDKEKCLNAGMDDYIPKPLEETVVRDTLAKWLTSS